MLEFYAKQLEELGSQTTQLIQNIKSTQDIIRITLDSQRNSVMIMEVRIAMASFGISFGTLVAGIFGMNLKSGFEMDPLLFYGTTLGIVSSTAILSVALLRQLRKFVHTS